MSSALHFEGGKQSKTQPLLREPSACLLPSCLASLCFAFQLCCCNLARRELLQYQLLPLLRQSRVIAGGGSNFFLMNLLQTLSTVIRFYFLSSQAWPQCTVRKFRNIPLFPENLKTSCFSVPFSAWHIPYNTAGIVWPNQALVLHPGIFLDAQTVQTRKRPVQNRINYRVCVFKSIYIYSGHP